MRTKNKQAVTFRFLDNVSCPFFGDTKSQMPVKRQKRDISATATAVDVRETEGMLKKTDRVDKSVAITVVAAIVSHLFLVGRSA